MIASRLFIAGAIAAMFSSAGLAQTAPDPVANTTQRNANQQQRIEQGLQSGQLNTREAALLEREQAHVNHMQAAALKDGSMTDAERARIAQAQNQASRDIAREKHDAQTGNPQSASSQRMQAAVARDANQQQRVANGVKTGALTNREVAQVEHGQAQAARIQARAGADGHVGAAESDRVQRSENRRSAQIYRKKHNGATRG